MKALTIWWDQRAVGCLQMDQHGETHFSYYPEWLEDPAMPALSHSLPKQAESFNRRASRPFFEGLLPEEEQREAIAAALGLSKGNEFALLARIGGEVAGALTLWPEGQQPPKLEPNLETHQPLDDQALLSILDRLPKRPMLAGEEGLRLSLAGAQSKLPVVLLENGAIALPAPGQPTTHILKPAITRFAATTENEAFAMRLAAYIGLSVASVEIRQVEDRSFLLVERYDRLYTELGITRVHQEDFCQALGYPPTKKYASEGGPGLIHCFELVREVTSQPALEVLKLLDAVIFNVIIGNADAHGKNFSLLYRAETITLAPLYDLLCTVAYPELSPVFAMKLAKRGRLEEIQPEDWKAFAKTARLPVAFIRRRIREMTSLVQQQIVATQESLVAMAQDESALDRFGERIKQRAIRLAASI